MKKLIKIIVCISLISIFLVTRISAEVDPKKEKKFETVITITYNTATLLEAAALEKRIRAEHVNACKVDIQLKDIVQWTTLSSGGTVTYTDVR